MPAHTPGIQTTNSKHSSASLPTATFKHATLQTIAPSLPAWHSVYTFNSNQTQHAQTDAFKYTTCRGALLHRTPRQVTLSNTHTGDCQLVPTAPGWHACRGVSAVR